MITDTKNATQIVDEEKQMSKLPNVIWQEKD